MKISTRKFTLQPETYREVIALRDAIDLAIDHDATPDTQALSDLRASLGPIGTWRGRESNASEFVGVEISPAALQLVGTGLEILADWTDDPDYQTDDRSLTSTELRTLAGMINAWLVTA